MQRFRGFKSFLFLFLPILVMGENIRFTKDECINTKESNSFINHKVSNTRTDYYIQWNNNWIIPLNKEKDETFISSYEYDYLSCTYYNASSEWSSDGKSFNHGAIDIDAKDKDEDVFSIADGKILKSKIAKNDISMSYIQIQYITKKARAFNVLYGHTKPLEGLTINSQIEKGDKLGKIIKFGNPKHLHFSISSNLAYEPKPITVNGDDIFGRAYTHMVEPIQFLKDNEPLNFKNLDLCSEYNSININSTHIWDKSGIVLQDCEDNKAVFYNYDFNNQQSKYYLIDNGFWEKYKKNDFGIKYLGKPNSNEIKSINKTIDDVYVESCQIFDNGTLLWVNFQNKDKAISLHGLGVTQDCNAFENDYIFNGCFEDITDHKYSKEICTIKHKDIVNGYHDRTYKPDNKINRADFTKIILLAKYSQEEIDKAPDAKFTDIKSTDWYKKYADFAKEKEIIKGYPNGTFRGAKKINFAEASKIIVNTLIELTEPLTTENWFDSYIQKLEAKKIDLTNFKDSNGEYKVGENITRGQMAYLIYSIIKEN